MEDTESFKQWLQNFGASVLYSPKISIFSGDTKDTSFDLWKYEVSCLLSEKTYSRDALKQALCECLKGEAAKIVMRMGPSATLEELLEKNGRYLWHCGGRRDTSGSVLLVMLYKNLMKMLPHGVVVSRICLKKSEVRLKIEQEYGLNPNIESNKQRIKQVSCKTACRRGHWS